MGGVGGGGQNFCAGGQFQRCPHPRFISRLATGLRKLVRRPPSFNCAAFPKIIALGNCSGTGIVQDPR